MKNHPFSSFCVSPKGVKFEKQNKDETVLLMLRSHFITNFLWILSVIILLCIPLFCIFVFPDVFISLVPFLPNTFFVFFVFFYYLLVLMYGFISFLRWFYNVFIITEKRVIDIDYLGLVYHDVAVTELSLIEDAKYVKAGFLSSLFNMGDIILQTAGNKENFEISYAPQPEHAVKIISDIIRGIQPHD